MRTIQETDTTRICELLEKYRICDMNEWKNVEADLVITDPPFGINFNGKSEIYHRNPSYVVDGYVEWSKQEYGQRVEEMLKVIERNLKPNGQALIFSGWNNSNIIHDKILSSGKLTLRGKLYWTYNFAPVCERKPSHNVYEIFWVTKGDTWTYNHKCSTDHCLKGEPNLTTLRFKRDYKINMIKYPTRLPFKLLQCLIEHFSNPGDLIFDPLCGSGMVGVVAHFLRRDFIIGDLNPNGKKVFSVLLDYYLLKNGLVLDEITRTWWKRKTNIGNHQVV